MSADTNPDLLQLAQHGLEELRRLDIPITPEQEPGVIAAFGEVAQAAMALGNYDQSISVRAETGDQHVPWVDTLIQQGHLALPVRNGRVLFYMPGHEKNLPPTGVLHEYIRSLGPSLVEFLHEHTTPTTLEESVLKMRQIMNRNFANRTDDPTSFFGSSPRKVRHLPVNPIEAVRWLLRGNLLMPSSKGLLQIAQLEDFALINHIGDLSQLTRRPFIVSGFNFMETVNAFDQYVKVPNIIGKSSMGHAHREMKTRGFQSDADKKEIALYGRVLRELQDME